MLWHELDPANSSRREAKKPHSQYPGESQLLKARKGTNMDKLLSLHQEKELPQGIGPALPLSHWACSSALLPTLVRSSTKWAGLCPILHQRCNSPGRDPQFSWTLEQVRKFADKISREVPLPATKLTLKIMSHQYRKSFYNWLGVIQKVSI